MLPNYLQRELPPDEAAAVAAAGGRGGGGIRPLLLDAGRVLMLWGWGTLAATAVSSTGNRQQPDDASGNAATAARSFLRLLMWLLGVSLVTFSAAARRRFPRRGAGVTTTNLVMGRFCPPWN